jgi:hypothetical protein
MKAFWVFTVLSLNLGLPNLLSAGEIVDDIRAGIKNHLVPRIVAKEMCSCLYNSRLSFDLCKHKIGLPRLFSATPIISFKVVDHLIYVQARAVFPSLNKKVFYKSSAVFDTRRPEEGCRILVF